MCGIAGELGADKRFSYERVLSMLTFMKHRGPDGHGVIAGDRVSVGSTRLAISGPYDIPIPMTHEQSSTALAYNGEIYGLSLDDNHSDTSWLHQQLDSRGVTSVSRSDGMYALGFADTHHSRLDLTRDPWGIKPLYISLKGRRLSFASEIEPLAKANLETPELSPQALLEYVGLGCRVDNDTLMPSIKSLAPGAVLSAQAIGTGLSIRSKHYDTVAAQCTHYSAADVEGVAAALRDSVAECARTNSKLGLFLSGGLDSTALATILSEAGVEDVHCFSLILGRDGIRALSQLNLPGKAWHSWTLHTLAPEPEDIDWAFEEVLQITSEPCFPPSAAYTFLLSKMAADWGVRVVISGEGADELFGGYESHVAPQTLTSEKLGVGFYTDTNAFWWANRLAYGENQDASEKLRGKLEGLFGTHESDLRNLLVAEKVMSLRPLLHRLDHTSMRFSIEVRVPFLHGRVPDMASQTVGCDNRNKHVTKPELRRALEPLLGSLAWSTLKTPLRVPLTEWLEGSRFLKIRETLQSRHFTELMLGCRRKELSELISRLASSPSNSELQVAVRLYQAFRFCERLSK